MGLTDIAYIKEILSENGFHFLKARGQNFLIASWVPERIAEAAGLSRETGVLEIGPGIGCLTEKLSTLAKRVVAIELDRRLQPVLAQTLSGLPNVELVFDDALKLDIPALCDEKLSGMRVNACANLPYNITSPAIAALLSPRIFGAVTVMVQREVADRICSKPGDSEYGAFTLFCGWHAKAHKLFDVQPSCFFPAPKVVSSVLRFDILKEPPVNVTNEDSFFRVVRAAFGQRRKTLVNALLGGFPGLSREGILAALVSMGLDEKIRGERLGIAQFAELTERLTVGAAENG